MGCMLYYLHSQGELLTMVCPSPTPTPKQFINQQKLFDLIQRFRFENDLSPYKKSKFLCEIADVRSKEVPQNFSHQGFSAKRFCTNECKLGENLIGLVMSENENDALNRWLKSPGHAANLKASYTHSCLKCEYDEYIGMDYCVHIFGYY
jgi:uncharacterized protein YkwD